MRFLIVIAALSMACRPQAPTLAPGTEETPSGGPAPAEAPPRADTLDIRVEELGPADGVAAIDLDGDGTDEVVRIQAGVAHWGADLKAELGGVVQRSVRADLDGDGRSEAWVATGMGRAAREAPARVWRLDGAGVTKVWEAAGPRAQVPGLSVHGDRLWMTAFTGSRRAEGGWLSSEGWTTLSGGDLALAQHPLPGGGVAIGRIYGDQPKSDGDLRVEVSGSKRRLASLRGVRALASADLNGDGRDELLAADGWHYQYGAHGVARVVAHDLQAPDQLPTVLAWLPNDYAVMGVHPLPSGDLLLHGSHHLALAHRSGLGWQTTILAKIEETAVVAPMRTPEGAGALVSGDPARFIRWSHP